MSNASLLAIDQGTTSSRSILFSPDGKILALKQKELRLHTPHKGWVEQSPADIWADTLWACRGVIDEAQKTATKIAAIGITNQRETTIIWDRKTGEPVYNAIVWQDRRTADLCKKLKEAGHEQTVTEKTGLLLDPYFSATKIAWILDNIPGVRTRAQNGDLAFGTIDCFLLWKLTGGKIHSTDVTNASRTLLYNTREQKWDETLLKLFNIPAALLPEVKDNAATFGTTQTDLLGASYTIGGMAGDQHAALIGQACFKPGMIKSTYGTGCFVLMNTGNTFKTSQNRLLTTPAYRLDGEITYALEGSIFTAGAAIQWLRDNLGLFDDVSQCEALARSVPDNNQVYFVPAFTGLGAPYWEPKAKAMITGLSRESTSAHIIRAALEAQGYQSRDLMEAMKADSGATYDINLIRADGGLVANEFMCQFLADMLDRTVEIPAVTETTAWGAAVLAGLQSGVFSELEAIAQNWAPARRYTAQMQPPERQTLYKAWKTAIHSTLQGVN